MDMDSRKTRIPTYLKQGTDFSSIMKNTFMVGNVDICPCIHSMVVVTSPIGVHAPPAFAAITTRAPRSL
jgi:hypothetical protein